MQEQARLDVGCDLAHAVTSHDTESDIVVRSAMEISSDATKEERAQAVVDVKHLGERVGRLKSEIRQLEVDRVHCERDLEDYRATLQLSP